MRKAIQYLYNQLKKRLEEKTSFRIVKFPNGSCGVERISFGKKQYLEEDSFDTWYSSLENIEAYCQMEYYKAEQRLKYLRREFPTAKIITY